MLVQNWELFRKPILQDLQILGVVSDDYSLLLLLSDVVFPKGSCAGSLVLVVEALRYGT
jgi:hypothetical protein